MKVGLVYDPIYLKHDTGQHVENAQRLEAVISHLEQSQLKQQLTLIKPRAASTEEISLVHDNLYVSHILDIAQRGGGWLAVETVMSSDSYQAAIYMLNANSKVLPVVQYCLPCSTRTRSNPTISQNVTSKACVQVCIGKTYASVILAQLSNGHFKRQRQQITYASTTMQ